MGESNLNTFHSFVPPEEFSDLILQKMYSCVANYLSYINFLFFVELHEDLVTKNA